LKAPVAITAFAAWTPLGTWVNVGPVAGPAEGRLAPWAGAPTLARHHQWARTPNRQAVVLLKITQALLAARAAIEGAGSAPTLADTDLLLGTAKGSSEADIEFAKGLLERGHGLGSPSTFVYTLPTAAPAEVALALGLRGALATITAGTVSGLLAVARAANHVAQGRARACITGGIELGGWSSPSGAKEGEFVALLLLESSENKKLWPNVSSAELGFSHDDSGNAVASSSPMTTLLSLVSACAERGSQTPFEVSGRSSEGYWARVRCESSTRGTR